MNIQPTGNEPLVVSGRDVTAVLGPTNTGKTHLAIERMVAHESGVIGLPLRLLAREVYGRVCDKVGAAKVALITGEEKIVPAGAKYSVCTVEALPRETDAAFVAIDEVQIAGDLERGHIFTDRILHLRGRQETLLLGAATMRGILERLLRGVSVVTRPRLSHLAYAGSKKLTRLPRRSAIVAFSADEVYAIGELIRRQRGGVAVVLGALSPRTRNAQVALYQNGDVDYLVATDAIGMGLNLDVDHVAFAQNRKFDGFQFRDLAAAELGQIAGRAGRHMRDGTFGVTGQVDPLSDELVDKIESHDFDPVKVLQWRTADFDFASIDALKRSIETAAPVEGLTRALPAVDAQALNHLSNDPEIRRMAQGRERVALLWDACALPDFRKIAPAQHSELISSIYLDLARHGHVDEDYMAEQVKRASSSDGDIDALSHRIAQIRTWTFVSNRPGWLADAAHWREKTREIEDRLSDALHDRLTKRFVDRRTSVLMRRLRENTMLEAEISPAGTVTVEGHHVGELQGFRFTADQSADGEDGKAIRTAAQKALATEFERRAEKFATAANGDLALASDGAVRWIGAPVGTLAASEDPLRPRVVLLADEQLTGPARDKVAARAERFVNYQIDTLLKPLVDLKDAGQLSGMAKGIAFRLAEEFGVINRRDIAEDVRSLDQEGRAALRRLGVRFGAYHIFAPALLKPAPASLVTLLWALGHDGKDKPGFGDIVHALAAGRTSVVVNQSFDRDFYKLAGFRMLGRRAVRVDILERLADLIRPAITWRAGAGPRPEGAWDGAAFIVTPAMMSILGATPDDMEEILKGLGYRGEQKPAEEVKAKLAEIDAAAEAALQARMEAEAKARADAAASAEPVADAPEATIEEAAADAETGAAGSRLDAIAAGSDASEAKPEVAGDTAVTDSAGPAATQEEVAPEATEEAETAAVGMPVAEGASDEPAAAGALTGETTAAATEGPARQAAEAPAAADAPAATMAEPPAAVAGAIANTPTAETAETDEEPKPITLWRQARGDHRPRHRQGHRQGHDRGQGQRRGQSGGGNARAGTPGDGEKPKARPSGKARFDKRHGGKPDSHPEGGRGRNGADRKGGDKAWVQRKPRDERPARIDPDSPFAKLAALRDQLKK